MKIIKTIFALVLALSLVFISCIIGYADTIYQLDGYSYTDYGNNTVSVCGWDNRTPELILPNKIGDEYVAEVADFGLRGNTGITLLDITQPTNLRRIGMYAFADCSELSGEVVFPLRITDIGQSAFENCHSLESVVIYSNIDTIKRQTFYNCSYLNNVVLPVSVQKIEALAFSNCNRLESITIPNTVTEISGSAFLGDHKLTINCNYDSYAYHYAKEKNIPYILIDGVLLGDANGDGNVNINDVTTIQRHLAELTELEGIYLHAADVNQDGELSIADATEIQMYLAEYELQYPIGEVITQ